MPLYHTDRSCMHDRLIFLTPDYDEPATTGPLTHVEVGGDARGRDGLGDGDEALLDQEAEEDLRRRHALPLRHQPHHGVLQQLRYMAEGEERKTEQDE